MDEVIDLLLLSLSKKGVLPSHVPGLLRDVLYIVKDDEHFSLGNINRRLERVGWGEEILDERIFELICFIMDLGSMYNQ